jgi:hypothetical protein
LFKAVTSYKGVVAAKARKQEDSNKLEEYSKQAVSWRSAEEYKKSACEDLTFRFEDFMCAVAQ